MSIKGDEAYILGMNYTEESLKGAGALKGEKGDPGKDGFSPIATVTKANGVSTLTVTDSTDTTTVEIFDGKDGADGKDGLDGTDGKDGKDGQTPVVEIGGNGNWYVDGVDTGVSAKGTKGDTGEGFLVTKQYPSIDEMVADTDPASDSEVVVVVTGDIGNFYLRLTGYVDPNGITDGYLPIGSASDISTIKGDKGDDGLTPRIDPITKHWFIGETDTGVLAEGQNGADGADGKDGATPTIGTDNHWYIDGVDTGIVAQGQDGETPIIGADNHWYINGVDTGVVAQGQDGQDGKDGRSILSVTKDDDDNIVVTYSDNTSKVIGKLSVDVQADFLTSDGFGKLRFTDNKFQYYDEESSQWVDTFVTPDNTYIITLTPQPMKKFIATCNPDTMNVELRIDESNDTIVDGQSLCIVEKVIIRRKKDDFPTDENDGDLVLEIERKDFGTYKNKPYVDVIDGASAGDVYCYKAFPVANTGAIANLVDNEVSCTIKDYWLFGFKLDQNESDPSSMIEYIEDNENYHSSYMNYSTDMFDYGDWKDVWFIRDLKPCMLNYDGTVAYELDKNDYSLKADGTPSDIANDSFSGNAMVGIPKVYWKIIDNGDDTANIYFSNKKLDNDFVCWSHIDNNGNEIDYCYMPIYNGSNVSSRLRSLSGKTPIYNQTGTTEITLAKANNLTSDIIWYTEVFSDRMLINLLLLLIGKSTDTQTTFGNGHYAGGLSASSLLATGTLNNKGLFYGTNGTGKAVKVFGIENWLGNQFRRIAGWISDKGNQKIKMTYGQSDGSTVDGYNTDGSGYIAIGCTPSGTSGGYISKMTVTKNSLIPTIASGSATTYYTDGLWFGNSRVYYALVGGTSDNRLLVGALCSYLADTVSAAGWSFGASVSCKPLATT